MRRSVRWQAIFLLILILGGTGAVAYVLLSPGREASPQRAGRYVEGIAGAPQSINPLFSQYNDVDRDLCSLIFEGLTDLDERNVVIPLLAHAWEISADGLTYTFSLRKDVQWHDGAPFTARDVLFTVGVMSDPDFQAMDPSGLFDLWSSVKTEQIDDYTVRFTLSEPYTPFLDYTTMGILPEHLLAKIDTLTLADAQFNAAPVGTGPFRLKSATVQQVTLEANPTYYGTRPLLESITLRFYTDQESLFAAHAKGEIDGISQVSPALMPRLRTDRALKLYSARLSKYALALFNLTDEGLPFFDDPEVRRALLLGLDRQAIVNQVLGGQGIVAHSTMIPDTWAYDPDVFKYSYDPEKAQEMLEAAGWNDSDGDGVRDREGQRFQFSLITSDDPTWSRVVGEMSRQWGQIGIQAVSETVSFPRLIGEFLYPRRFEAILIAPEFAGDPDPYPFWHSTQASPDGQNWSGFSHARADEIMEQARTTADQALRIQLYREFQAIFADQVPAVLLYYPVYNYAIDGKIEGVQVAPMNDASDRFRTVAQWYAAPEGQGLRFNLAGLFKGKELPVDSSDL